MLLPLLVLLMMFLLLLLLLLLFLPVLLVITLLLLVLLVITLMMLLLPLLVVAFRFSLEILPFIGSPIPLPDVGHFLVGQSIATHFNVTWKIIRKDFLRNPFGEA